RRADGAGVPVPGRDRGCLGEPGDTNRCEARVLRSVAELPPTVPSPAVRGAAVLNGARMRKGSVERGDIRRQGCDRRRRNRGTAVAERAIFVVAPTLDRARGKQGARVTVTGRDG